MKKLNSITLNLSLEAFRNASKAVSDGDVTEKYYYEMLSEIFKSVAKGKNTAEWDSPADEPVVIDAVETCANLFADIEGPFYTKLSLQSHEITVNGETQKYGRAHIKFMW